MARVAVVISQGQSQHPDKRKLEEDLVARLLGESTVEVSIIPHWYDLDEQHPALLGLEGTTGPLIVLAWLYPRAAFWTLDRLGIRGSFRKSLLHEEDPEADDAEASEVDDGDDTPRTVLQQQPDRARADRPIYCLDLRGDAGLDELIAETLRIAKELTTPVVGLNVIGDTASSLSKPAPQPVESTPPRRRWYPVIDFSRCTNCMECIDFCLFGVYGIDAAETILVEQPDNCRKGCPACSRVCPENAIIFPQHKSPAIAGADIDGGGGFKIDLSRLFGAPDAQAIAARERDEQLMLAGRTPVGNAGRPAETVASEGTPSPAAASDVATATAPSTSPKDELDELLDELDAFEL